MYADDTQLWASGKPSKVAGVRRLLSVPNASLWCASNRPKSNDKIFEIVSYSTHTNLLKFASYGTASAIGTYASCEPGVWLDPELMLRQHITKTVGSLLLSCTSSPPDTPAHRLQYHSPSGAGPHNHAARFLKCCVSWPTSLYRPSATACTELCSPAGALVASASARHSSSNPAKSAILQFRVTVKLYTIASNLVRDYRTISTWYTSFQPSPHVQNSVLLTTLTSKRGK